MNTLPAGKEETSKKQNGCRRSHGRRMVRGALLVLATGLVAWPVWNWVAVPLLALPALTYWQMVGIVALIGLISMLFSGAMVRKAHREDAAYAWASCRRTADTRQG